MYIYICVFVIRFSHQPLFFLNAEAKHVFAQSYPTWSRRRHDRACSVPTSCDREQAIQISATICMCFGYGCATNLFLKHLQQQNYICSIIPDLKQATAWPSMLNLSQLHTSDRQNELYKLLQLFFSDKKQSKQWFIKLVVFFCFFRLHVKCATFSYTLDEQISLHLFARQVLWFFSGT